MFNSLRIALKNNILSEKIRPMNNQLKYFLTRILVKHRKYRCSQSPPASEAGFSLLEVVVVAISIGILSAIAAPAWDAFVTRQRIRTVNNQVLQALQSAQTQARGKKETLTIRFNPDNNTTYFDTDDGTLAYKIYREGLEREDIQDLPPEKMNVAGQIDESKILLSTQAYGDSTIAAITFNDMGAVKPPENVIANQDNPLFIVTVSTAQGNGTRCVRVETLLGAMRIAEGDDPDTGCGN